MLQGADWPWRPRLGNNDRLWARSTVYAVVACTASLQGAVTSASAPPAAAGLAIARASRRFGHVLLTWLFLPFFSFVVKTEAVGLAMSLREAPRDPSYQEYIRTRVCNSILWGLSRQNSKFVIGDAQPLSFQVVMHSTLNTCMLALSRSSIFLTGISG